ncbi:MAG: hypothetical protein ABEI78_01455, partial [Candidatus Nanohaloarchaea archaeon]
PAGRDLKSRAFGHLATPACLIYILIRKFFKGLPEGLRTGLYFQIFLRKRKEEKTGIFEILLKFLVKAVKSVACQSCCDRAQGMEYQQPGRSR